MAEHKSERVHNTRKICNRFHIGHYKIFNEPELIEPMCIFWLYAPMIIVRLDMLSSAFALHSHNSNNIFSLFHMLAQANHSLDFILNFAANRKKTNEKAITVYPHYFMMDSGGMSPPKHCQKSSAENVNKM